MAFRDYGEFIGALNAHGVRYLVVGARAVGSNGLGARLLGIGECVKELAEFA